MTPEQVAKGKTILLAMLKEVPLEALEIKPYYRKFLRMLERDGKIKCGEDFRWYIVQEGSL